MRVRAEDDPDEDQEALVPRRPAVLGLKVADDAEAKTVRYVCYAVAGMTGLLIFHFIMHVAHSGHVRHAFVHLIIAGFLPALGYQAVQHRSTRMVWAFHVSTIITAVFHAVALIVVMLVVIDLENSDLEVSCSSHVVPAYECPHAALDTLYGHFSDEGDIWRCNNGFCISSHGRCDEEPNCYDHSDEIGCPDPSTPEQLAHSPMEPWRKKVLNKEAREFCKQRMSAEQSRASRLKYWWIFVSLPMYSLCCFAGYYSLEFYVQLRLANLGVRVSPNSEGATVFERDQDMPYARDEEMREVE